MPNAIYSPQKLSIYHIVNDQFLISCYHTTDDQYNRRRKHTRIAQAARDAKIADRYGIQVHQHTLG